MRKELTYQCVGGNHFNGKPDTHVFTTSNKQVQKAHDGMHRYCKGIVKDVTEWREQQAVETRAKLRELGIEPTREGDPYADEGDPYADEKRYMPGPDGQPIEI